MCVIMLFFFFKQKTAYEMLRSLVGSEMCIRDSDGPEDDGDDDECDEAGHEEQHGQHHPGDEQNSHGDRRREIPAGFGVDPVHRLPGVVQGGMLVPRPLHLVQSSRSSASLCLSSSSTESVLSLIHISEPTRLLSI